MITNLKQAELPENHGVILLSESGAGKFCTPHKHVEIFEHVGHKQHFGGDNNWSVIVETNTDGYWKFFIREYRMSHDQAAKMFYKYAK
jgi:hypothetical protein